MERRACLTLMPLVRHVSAVLAASRTARMAQPIGLDMQSEVRLSPEERAASWTDFRGLVTAPTSNRGP
eukprot:scaffold36747_cov63-Phaeocystis_antarctica.AAC.2